MDTQASLGQLLIGTCDQNSPLHKLAGHSDVLELIWASVTQKVARELMAATMAEEHVAFAHVDNVRFPPQTGLNVNMMPFVLGKKSSLPENLHGYWQMIKLCVHTLVQPQESHDAPPPGERVGYLTVHESIVQTGCSQRRPGLHTEGFTRAPCDSGTIQQLPRWHPWGFGHAMGKGRYEGGIFMASNVDDSCHIYNAIVPAELVGKGGDVEHLREVLDEHFPKPPKPRSRWPNDPELHDHAGKPRCHMHMEGDDIFQQQPVRGPISLQANELVWFTDRTPHESLTLEVGQRRQFFRLVTGGIDTWFAAHSTPNPLGVQPQAKIVDYDKFTGELPTPRGEASLETATSPEQTFSANQLRTALPDADAGADLEEATVLQSTTVA